MCISESAYLFSLCWFKHNEKFNGDSTNKASIDLSPIEVMASPPVLLMLDQLSEIRIIWEHKAWVCSSPPLLLALSPLYVLPLPNDSKKLYYNNKQGFRLPSNNTPNTYTSSTGDCIDFYWIFKIDLFLWQWLRCHHCKTIFESIKV